jgi:hypothetical protein
MDKKDIQSKIDELVEWEKPIRLKKDAEIASNQKKIRKQLLDMGHEEEDVDRVMAEMLEDSRVIVDGVNITVPRKLKGIKHEPKLCSLGCGKIAVDQRIDIKLQNFPEKHWIEKCNFCQYYRMPDGKFARNSQQLYAELIKKKNKAAK